jgi:hypothetical protein
MQLPQVLERLEPRRHRRQPGAVAQIQLLQTRERPNHAGSAGAHAAAADGGSGDRRGAGLPARPGWRGEGEIAKRLRKAAWEEAAARKAAEEEAARKAAEEEAARTQPFVTLSVCLLAEADGRQARFGFGGGFGAGGGLGSAAPAFGQKAPLGAGASPVVGAPGALRSDSATPFGGVPFGALLLTSARRGRTLSRRT